MRTIRRVVLQWPRFGPYHAVRIDAFAHLAAAYGVETLALETASGELTYARMARGSVQGTSAETLFEGKTFETLDPPAIRRAVMAALDRIDPDAVAVNSYSLPDARACLAWCRKRRRVAVVMTDSRREDAPRQPLREALKAAVVRLFDAALVGGTAHLRYMTELGIPQDRIFFGCDAVDNAYFARAVELRADPAPSSLPGLTDPRPFFLASSRFILRKNLSGLLRAYSRYRLESAKPWRLVLLGDGEARRDLESLIRESGLSREVTLPGFMDSEQVLHYYARAAAFVHPALADQWGLVVNEAMAAGLPVIVSRQSGCSEDLVDDGENGFRFDATDEAHLAELLVRMSGSGVDRTAMGRRSQEIIAHWGPNRFARGLWQAMDAGRPTAGRGFEPQGYLVLRLLDLLARSVRSFHDVEA